MVLHNEDKIRSICGKKLIQKNVIIFHSQVQVLHTGI